MTQTDNSNDIDCSYVPVPGEPHTVEAPAESRGKLKAGIVIFCGLLSLASLVAYTGYIAPNNKRDELYSTLKSHSNEDKYKTIPFRKWEPVSRGVSVGVSEKSNRMFKTKTNVRTYPWNNHMLSWQRTAFHFQPKHNWMNGPLYYKGRYHFFYQYNPNGAVWGDIVWGHAVSKDLVHWLHLPLAMVADEWYDLNGVWTGSATILPNGELVMLYTGATNESIQVQNLAYPANTSDPLLVNWTKYSENPVLFPPPEVNFIDFRDPTTAWLTSQGKWRISIGSKINETGVALVYDTKDFKTFERVEGMLRRVQETGMWECVDFFPVSTKLDNGLDTSVNDDGVKHVMKVSLDEERHDYYAIGTYNESIADFVPDDINKDVGIGLRYDYGVFYASKTFYDQSKKRRVLWSWVAESDSEYVDVEKGWASLMGIPRTLVLDKKTGSNLLQWPVKEVESLRTKSHKFENLQVKPGSIVSLDIGTATQLDILAEFNIDEKAINETRETNVEYNCETSDGARARGALGPFGLLVLANDNLSEKTPIYFYIVKGRDGNLKTSFCSDQSRSSLATDVSKKIFGSLVPVLQDEKLSLRILVDHSIIESFAQGGRTCVTSRVYPTKAIYRKARLFLFNNATEATVYASLEVWHMKSASKKPFHYDQMS
ncbi:hypothetical protein RYX36_003293 [Vicia faba]